MDGPGAFRVAKNFNQPQSTARIRRDPAALGGVQPGMVGLGVAPGPAVLDTRSLVGLARCEPSTPKLMAAATRATEDEVVLTDETTSTGAEEPGDQPDPEELRLLVTEHGDAIYRLAVSIVRDAPLAEDIAQEVLIKAWTALPTLRDRRALRSWVLRIAHNTSISTLRARRALVVDPIDLPEPAMVPEHSVESTVQGSVVMDDFTEALNQLDDLSRSIVVLRELEGLSYDEIAEVLGVPLPTVKTRLLRARRRLGAAMRGWE